MYITLYTTFSNILLKIGNTNIGLELPALVESPPFGMGVTLANFKQSGKIPVRNDKLIMTQNMRNALFFSKQKLRLY